MNSKLNLVIWVIAVALLFGAIYVLYENNKPLPNPPQVTNQEQKALAPDFALNDINGNQVKLSDYRGKIVVLNFWAVWCKYCKVEMPDFNELNAELEKGNDAVILAIDVQEDINTVKKYLNDNKITLKVLLDENGAISQKYNVSGFPTTFIINRDGSLAKTFPGATNKEAVLEAINKAKW